MCFFYYDAKLKGKIKIENMASPRRLPFFYHINAESVSLVSAFEVPSLILYSFINYRLIPNDLSVNS